MTTRPKIATIFFDYQVIVLIDEVSYQMTGSFVWKIHITFRNKILILHLTNAYWSAN
jgi:hypothetical protein